MTVTPTKGAPMDHLLQHDHGDHWDAADMALLAELGPDPDLSWQDVADQLGRTAMACRSKWYRMR